MSALFERCLIRITRFRIKWLAMFLCRYDIPRARSEGRHRPFDGAVVHTCEDRRPSINPAALEADKKTCLTVHRNERRMPQKTGNATLLIVQNLVRHPNREGCFPVDCNSTASLRPRLLRFDALFSAPGSRPRLPFPG